MKKKLHIAVIGCGYFGQKRMQACIDISDVATLVGVVDSNSIIAKKVGELFHVPFATSIKQLRNHIPVDAAIVATPNKYHATCVIEALEEGLHVLCEKPLATSVTEAKRIVKASIKYHRFVKTGSNHRFFPTIQKAYALIQKGTIGNVLYVKGSIGTNGSHTKQSWFWNKDISGGGTYIDNACHMLDITRWIMGDFFSCVGVVGNIYWKNAAVEDIAAGMYKTKNGRFAMITSSWTQWVGYMSLEVWGDKGYILIDSKQGQTMILGKTNSEKTKIFDFSHKPISSYQDELRYFVSCIAKNIEPQPTAVDGQAVIHMIEGVYTSAKQNKTIHL